MREAIGSEVFFKAIIIFTLIFAAFVAVAVTYNKAYKIKNEAMFIVEKYEGINDNSVAIINNYFRNNGYNTKGVCDAGELGVSDLNDPHTTESNGKDTFYYCLKDTKRGSKSYVTVKVFFRFSLPFLGDLMTFQVTGETKGIRVYS